jgi:hypothetical protein
MVWLKGLLLRQYSPNLPGHLVGLRNDHDIEWPALAHLFEPWIRLCVVAVHHSRSVNQ